jgi:signal transduction histidine kinase
MSQRRSLGWPILLGVVMIVLLIMVTVGWITVNVMGALRGQNAALYWSLLAVGTTILLLLLTGVVLYLWLSIKAIRLSQRQANFIDSVTHEFKSPLASLRLYLQTLTRRHQVSEEQRAKFYQFMVEDLERLDNLVDHLLEAARTDRRAQPGELKDVPLDSVLAQCAQVACQQHQRASDAIKLHVEPAVVRARPTDVEIVFRNLLDNALKYSGPDAQVLIESHVTRQQESVTRIIDNGPGIPVQWRRKIFGRFVRMGNELERSTQGTGLGLYIVHTLVGQMRGKVIARGRSGQSGTVFEVRLPLAPDAELAATGESTDAKP